MTLRYDARVSTTDQYANDAHEPPADHPSDHPSVHRDFDAAACSRFLKATAGRPTPPHLIRALAAVAAAPPADGSRPRAAELGCGAGNDAVYLATQGFDVTVVDEFDEALQSARELAAAARVVDRLELHQARFETFDFPVAAFECVHARFSLPFCPPAHFAGMWDGLLGSLRPGAVLAATLFGPRDTFVAEDRRTRIVAFTHEEVTELLAPLETLELQEDEKDGHTATGRAKHWHVYHLLARRPMAE